MKIIIGNQKNYLGKKETVDFIEKLNKSSWKDDVIICPSIVFLSSCVNSDLILGSQYVTVKCPFSSGVSVDQLKDLDIKYCIVGHSDNRNNFKEDDCGASLKAKLLLNNGITPVYCFSESERFASDEDLSIWIKEYVSLLKDNLDNEEIRKIVFAYEPFYNINNSKTSNASLDFKGIGKVMDLFKLEIKKQCDSDIKLLYGGNVNPNNAHELNQIKSLDGYLIGRASSDFDTFEKLVSVINNS